MHAITNTTLHIRRKLRTYSSYIITIFLLTQTHLILELRCWQLELYVVVALISYLRLDSSKDGIEQ